MKKDIVLTTFFTIIQAILLLAVKGFSYPLLPVVFMLFLFSYIAIEDWRTGLISLHLNVGIFICAVLYAFMREFNGSVIGVNLLCFVVPFILLEFVFQKFVNKEKDEERFLIGGGDIILFAAMSFLLSTPNMMVMLFIASLLSIIISKFIGKSRVHFAPMILIGFLIAFLWGEFLLESFVNLLVNVIYGGLS